jgi:hypothetical protein
MDDPVDKWLLEKFGTPSAFLDALEKESDWSFIIKIHALLETALNHSLAVFFARSPTTEDNTPQVQALTDIFSLLETSNRDTGKSAFAKACGLLSDRHIAFIKRMSEIRNKLAHNIRNVDFKLIDHIAKFTKQQSANWRQSLCWERKSFGESDEWPSGVSEEMARDNPKHAITLCTRSILVSCFCIDSAYGNEGIGYVGKVIESATQRLVSDELRAARLRIEELERATTIPKE